MKPAVAGSGIQFGNSMVAFGKLGNVCDPRSPCCTDLKFNPLLPYPHFIIASSPYPSSEITAPSSLFPPTFDMSDQSRSLQLGMLFEAALEDYKQQTGIELAEHPLAERLLDCNTVESVTVILREQAQDFKEFWEKDKILKPLEKVLTVLNGLTSAADLGQSYGLVCP
jgi:hypothetical protein